MYYIKMMFHKQKLINIHNSTYIFILISFFAGYFEYIFLFLLVILVHESGHYLFAVLNGINVREIEIYPFGGITLFDTDLNIKIKKEFFCLIGGIIFQLLFYYLIIKLYKFNFITDHVFNIIKKINILLISFNFMPILPLDGGKLLNLILDYFFTYKISNIISIIISLIFILLFLIYNKTIFGILLCIFLLKNIIIETINLKLKYNKFLLERYLNNYTFNKVKIVKNIYKLKRDYTHIINNCFEEKILHEMFDREV